MSELTGYKDMNGKEYKMNDIVLNTFFGDLWLVIKFTEQEMKDNNYECPYGLALFGDKNLYCEELDTPEQFESVLSEGDEYYKETLDLLKATADEENGVEHKEV